MNHTPLPWVIEHTAQGDEIWTANGEPVAEFLSESHAVLIIHRVNNWDGLVDALEAVLLGWDNWARIGVMEDGIEKARAALAAARTGEKK